MIKWTQILDDLYTDWLLDTYPDQIHTKEDLNNMADRGFEIEAFKDKVIQELEDL